MQNKKINTNLPKIIITGASGFIGRNYVEAIVDKFVIFCIARRSQHEAGIKKHENIKWIQADIGDFANLEEVAQSIKKFGSIDFVIHLAGYYDFTMKNLPEYENTNIKGTENILKIAKLVEVKRFIFASSLAACKFTEQQQLITEQTPPDANFPYAKSKKAGEKLVKEYSKFFSCTIIRFAAVFSDWCEYPPLYIFLETWLSNKWNKNIIGGKGESSITYIHIHDLIKHLNKIIKLSDKLPQISTYIASQSGTISHNDLYKAATKYYYGKTSKSIKIPKFIAVPGIAIRFNICKLFGIQNFEQLWMVKYIDKKLRIDATYTNKTLLWNTTSRYDILRRLLFLVDKIKNNQIEWKLRNEAVLKRITQRHNIIVYNIFLENRETIVDAMIKYVMLPQNKDKFRSYQNLDNNILKCCTTLIYQLISTTIKTKDRLIMKNYLQFIIYRRFIEKFTIEEIVNFINSLVNIINKFLLSRPDIENFKEEVYDSITITMQLTIDEIEDYFEYLQTQAPESFPDLSELPLLSNCEDFRRVVRELENTSPEIHEFVSDIDLKMQND